METSEGGFGESESIEIPFDTASLDKMSPRQQLSRKLSFAREEQGWVHSLNSAPRIDMCKMSVFKRFLTLLTAFQN